MMTPDGSHFSAALDEARRSLDRLLDANPVPAGARPSPLPARSGVYLFSEPDAGYLYVGRTRNLRARIRQHCPGRMPPRGSVAPGATFAVKIARKSTGAVPTFQRRGGLRDLFANDETWRTAFAAAVERIRNMEVRYVEEADPLRHAVLELYAMIELRTPFNTFETT